MATTPARDKGIDFAVTDETLREMVRTIVRKADPEQIILFGSRARGEARPDSDIDLIVIEKEPYGRTRSRRLRAAMLYEALMRCGVPTDILLYSQSEVNYWRHSINNVLARALREGKILYARP